VQVRTLWLTDFRNYRSAQLDLAPGLTAVVGANGEGKTNLLEALAWLASVSSFRAAPAEALVRRGAPFAVVRALAEREGRELLLEAQIQPSGRSRVLVNRQPLRRSRDLLGALRVSVFTPDDLAIVKDGPGERRRFIDEALVSLHPRNDALRSALDKVLRQRNALLKSAGGRLDESAAFTLDVWDAKLAESGAALTAARLDLLDRIRPLLGATYDALARRPAVVAAAYEAAWAGTAIAAAAVAGDRAQGGGGDVDGDLLDDSAGPAGLGDGADDGGGRAGEAADDGGGRAGEAADDGGGRAGEAAGDRAGRAGDVVDDRAGGLGAALGDALAAARADDVRRGVSTVGPHRDDIGLTIGGAPARTQASQGEQRTLALALRLAVHHVVATAAESPPVLLLDDVFSELDPDRSAALLAHLPEGQTLLTTASGLPPTAQPERVVRIAGGTIAE
jgi:DNA replication and repair protein RecF